MFKLTFLISIPIILAVACPAEPVGWLVEANAIIEGEEQNLGNLLKKLKSLRQQQDDAVKESNAAFSETIGEKGDSPSLDRFKREELKRIRTAARISELERKVVTSQFRVTELKKVMVLATKESNDVNDRYSQEITKLKSKYTKDFADIMSREKDPVEQQRSAIAILLRKLARSLNIIAKPQESLKTTPDVDTPSPQALQEKSNDTVLTTRTVPRFNSSVEIGEQERQRHLAREKRALERRIFAARRAPTRNVEKSSAEPTTITPNIQSQPKTQIKIKGNREKKMVSTRSIKPTTPSRTSTDALFIDDFDSSHFRNSLGNRTSVYKRAPSSVISEIVQDLIEDQKSQVLKLSFNKQSSGGPHGHGGWCGYYSVLKNPDGTYLDASGYKYITLWIKGGNGSENFVLGLADKRWENLDDTVKSKQITDYLGKSSLGNAWQKVRIPLSEFSLNTTKLATVTIGFESKCFASGGGQGTLYIDDIALEN